jgi:hypothetical protein
MGENSEFHVGDDLGSIHQMASLKWTHRKELYILLRNHTCNLLVTALSTEKIDPDVPKSSSSSIPAG